VYRILETLPASIRRWVYLKELDFDPGELADIRFKLAEHRWEREQAFRLVHGMYIKRGIIDPDHNNMQFSAYSVLPDTAICVAVRGERVLGTMMLIEDSPIGLPMEETHPEEIAALRARGGRIAEVGALAVSPDGRRKGLQIMMINLCMRWASRHRRVSRAAFAVHPRAADFYKTVIFCEPLGPVRPYKTLIQAPSAPLACDLDVFFERSRELYNRDPKVSTATAPTKNLHRFIYAESINGLEVSPEGPAEGVSHLPPWTEGDFQYFVEQLDARPRGLPLHQNKLLLHHYPFLHRVLNDDGRSWSAVGARPGASSSLRPLDVVD
jgi:GNAT superfamily N-acetyltransferase